jgi:endonuclease G, mitochondrial
MAREDADRDQEAVERGVEAAQRWRRRRTERARKQRALRRRDYLRADTPERLARWAARHERWFEVLAAEDAAAARPPATGEEPPALRREDVSNEMVERILGRTRDLLSVEFFELGLLASRCVGLVSTRDQPNGTGFLVAPGLMLTNEHVLRTAGEARGSDLELDFEENRVGEPKQVERFRLLPDEFFLAHRELDFTLVAVSTTSHRGTRLDGFDVLPLIGEEGKVRIGEAVNVVQHPGGRVKQVVIRDNRLVDLPEGPDMGAYFHYEADTEKGSSGSPVFNDFWEVVALHHSSVPATDAEGRLVDADGTVLGPDERDRTVWVANEGIRVSRIVAAVRDADLPPAMQQVRDEALRTWQVRGDPAEAANAPLSPVVGSAGDGSTGTEDTTGTTDTIGTTDAPGRETVTTALVRPREHRESTVRGSGPRVTVDVTAGATPFRLTVELEPLGEDVEVTP